MVEDPAGFFEFLKAFFFFAKFLRMRDQAAAGTPRRMFDVQHLVKQHIFHRAPRNAGPVHPAIQDDLVGAGIIAAKLAAPALGAPPDVRTPQTPSKIGAVQLFK